MRKRTDGYDTEKVNRGCRNGCAYTRGSRRYIRSVFCLLLCLVLAVTASCGKQQGTNVPTETASETEASGSLSTVKKGSVEYEGSYYTYNSHLSNFLFLGIDKEELTDTTPGKADAGQADAQFVVSWDRVTGNVTVISIPRDTITEVTAYSVDGTEMGPVETHISYAYGYGDGKHKSCELAKEAVSRLLYRIPIQGYMAITMEAFTSMMDVLETVEMELPNDSLVFADPDWTKGTVITVDASNVETVLRRRDVTEDNTAIYRLERQNVFLEACFNKINTLFATDPGIISDIYMSMEPYMVTNIGNDQLVKIMEGLKSGGTVDKWTVPGEAVQTELFDEYHVDEDALYELLLKSLYIKEE